MYKTFVSSADDEPSEAPDPAALVAQLRELQQQLREQSGQDILTGAWTRRAILGQLEQVHARSMRDGRAFGVMKLAVDHFSVSEFSEVDPVAQQVLITVAARLKETLRGGDAIGRVSGAEFLCLLEGCDIESARMVAERCRLAVSALPVRIEHEGASITMVTARAALVMVHPNAEISTGAMVERTDDLLTQAVLQGREQVSIAVVAPPA